MTTRVNDTQGTPIDLGTEILARMLPARELAEALAAEPLDTVEPFLEDLKSMGDQDAMPDFPLGVWLLSQVYHCPRKGDPFGSSPWARAFTN